MLGWATANSTLVPLAAKAGGHHVTMHKTCSEVYQHKGIMVGLTDTQMLLRTYFYGLGFILDRLNNIWGWRPHAG